MLPCYVIQCYNIEVIVLDMSHFLDNTTSLCWNWIAHHVMQVSISSFPFYFAQFVFILDSSFAIIQVLSGLNSISVF